MPANRRTASASFKSPGAKYGTSGKHHALLLANHGPVVAGTSLTAAADAIEELEETAKLFLLLQGKRIRSLDVDEVEALRARYPT